MTFINLTTISFGLTIVITLIFKKMISEKSRVPVKINKETSQIKK